MRKLLQNGSLTLGSILFCLVALEIVLRLVDSVPLWPPRNLIVEKVDQLKVNLAIDYDPLLGYVLKSNTQSGTGTNTYTFGDYGVRMNSSEIKPLPKNAVLAVGDSFTSGSEVWDAETWPAYLERFLGVPVINAGAGGWGADQITLRAESLIPVLSPSLVIVDFLVDDIERAEYEFHGGVNKPYFLVKDGELIHMNYPVPPYRGTRHEMGRLRSVLGYSYLVSWVMDRIGQGEWWWRNWSNFYKKVDNDGAEVSCLLLERLKKQTDAHGIPLVLVIQYGAPHLKGWSEPSDHEKTVRDCAEKLGITVVDFWEPLKQIYDSDPRRICALYVNQDDRCEVLGHMSPEGNELTARLIAEALSAL